MRVIARIVICGFCLTTTANCSDGSGPFQLISVVETDSIDESDLPVVDTTGGGVEDATSEEITPPQQAPGGTAGIEDPFEGEPPDEIEIEASTLLETLAVADGVDTPLIGIVVVVDPVTDERAIIQRDGLYQFDESALSLEGSKLVLSSDIPGAFLVSSGGRQSDAAGIVGIATLEEDIPVGGIATFNGGASGFLITSTAGFDLTNGQSLVSVDFEAGTVTAELSEFTSVSQISGNVTSAPIDTIVWRNAEILGSSIVGGTLEVQNGFDEVIDLTGDNTRFESLGQFFGSSEVTETPLEVGGLVFATGDEGKIFGSFIAD